MNGKEDVYTSLELGNSCLRLDSFKWGWANSIARGAI